MKDDLREQVARAMCVAGGFDPDEIMPNDGPRWRYYLPSTDAALAVMQSHYDALQAERDRMREALESVVNNCGQCGGYGTYPAEETVTGKVLWWDCSNPACATARAALGGEHG